MKPNDPNYPGPKLTTHKPVETIRTFEDLIDALMFYGAVYVNDPGEVRDRRWFYDHARIGWVIRMLRDQNFIKIKPRKPL